MPDAQATHQPQHTHRSRVKSAASARPKNRRQQEDRESAGPPKKILDSIDPPKPLEHGGRAVLADIALLRSHKPQPVRGSPSSPPSTSGSAFARRLAAAASAPQFDSEFDRPTAGTSAHRVPLGAVAVTLPVASAIAQAQCNASIAYGTPAGQLSELGVVIADRPRRPKSGGATAASRREVSPAMRSVSSTHALPAARAPARSGEQHRAGDDEQNRESGVRSMWPAQRVAGDASDGQGALAPVVGSWVKRSSR